MSSEGGKGWVLRKPVPFVPTPYPVVRRMLDLADVDEGETVLDLGCGDGRILFTAAEEYGARAIGYELRPRLVNHIRRKAKLMRLDEMVQVVKQDFTAVPLPNADVITLYLTRDVLSLIKPRLETALSRGARIVSHGFSIPGLMPAEVEKRKGKVVYLYKGVKRL
ncbi:MAG: methyltransferase domain-containing protein [Candidatus Caldarchaeum sp.]